MAAATITTLRKNTAMRSTIITSTTMMIAGTGITIMMTMMIAGTGITIMMTMMTTIAGAGITIMTTMMTTIAGAGIITMTTAVSLPLSTSTSRARSRRSFW